jgi:GntR family transcriptional regulator/MocR family aminotransferase
MRKVYAERRRALLAALAQHTPDLAPLPGAARLHVTALARRPMDTQAVLARAAAAGLALQDLKPFAATHDPPAGLILGYGLIDTADLDPAIRALAKARAD